MSGSRINSIIIFSFLLMALVSQSVKVIPVGRTGVIFNLKGGIEQKALHEGIHFLIPFVQSLIIFDTRIVTYSFTDDTRSADLRLGSPIIAKTKDGQIVGLEMSLVTQIDKEKTPEVYQKLRTDYPPVLRDKTGKIMQEVIARHVADALYTEKTRQTVATEAASALSESFGQIGFNLKDVLLRKIEFSDEYINAIEAKQIALQRAQLAQIRKAIAIKEKQIEIIKGEAKAQELAIKGKVIQANPKVAELEFLESLEKSERQIPVIIGLEGNTFVNLDRIIQDSN